MAEIIRPLAAREQVAALVRRNILTGTYHSNQILSLDEVAAEAGCSRTPVREAFQMLAAEDWIDLRPNRGAVVREITEEFINDHFWIRTFLGEEASARACRSRTKKTPIHLALLEGARAVENRDVIAYNEANDNFHMAIWTAAASEHLKSILGQLWNGLSLDYGISSEDYISYSQEEHEVPWAAIEAFDEERARQAVRSHISHSQRNIMARLKLERNGRTDSNLLVDKAVGEIVK